MQPEAGSLVTPKVRLLEPLRAGGMGTVWVAEHLTLETKVAVKFIAADLVAKGEGAIERFRREAKAVAKLQSPHVVTLLDHGVTDDELPYIVMELLEGETLGDRLKRGPLSAVEMATIVKQVCKALGEAHRRGTVHRDIKPSNLFLIQNEDELFVKVLDFGIAKGAEEADTDVTATGAMVGTLHYMSPEQMKDARGATPASDLWSLAVVAYHALTGRRPFDAATPVALWQLMVKEEIPPPSELAEVDPALDAWFRRALRCDPVDRFESAREMASALSECVSGLQPQTSSARRSDDAALVSSDEEMPTADFLAREALGVQSDEEPSPDASKADATESRQPQELSLQSQDAPTHVVVAPAPKSVVRRRKSMAQGFLLGVISLAVIAVLLFWLAREQVPPPSSTTSSATPQQPVVATAVTTPSPNVTAATATATASIPPKPLRKHWPIGCTAERRPCGVGCCMWDHGCEPVGCTNALPEGQRWDLRLANIGVSPENQPQQTRPLRKAELWMRIGKKGKRQPVFDDQAVVVTTEDLKQPIYTWVQPNVDSLPDVVDLPPWSKRSPSGKLLCRGLIHRANRAGFTYQVWLSATPAGETPPEPCLKVR